MTTSDELAEVRERVRARYAQAANAVTSGGVATCSDSCQGGNETGTGSELYGAAEQSEVPEDAVSASLGCGNPIAVAGLQAGETVLDLGSGGGIDVLLSARRVGPAGKAYGLDMTDEMLNLARDNAAKAGATNAEFLHGHIESIPLPGESVDVIISNCVINLSGSKAAVFAESFRVLRPGGRFGVSDILAEDHLTAAERTERGRHVGCIAGALSFTEYRDGLTRAGFTGISITPTHKVTDGMHSAIIQAIKPGPHQGPAPRRGRREARAAGTQAGLVVAPMTEMMSGVDKPDDAVAADGLDEQLISQMVDRAKAGGLQLIGEGGVLQQLTKRLLGAAQAGAFYAPG